MKISRRPSSTRAQADAELKATEAVRKKTETTYQEGEKAASEVEAAEAELAEALARAHRVSKEKLKPEQLSADHAQVSDQ